MSVISVLAVLCALLTRAQCPDTCSEQRRPVMTVKGNLFPNKKYNVLLLGTTVELFCTSETNQLRIVRAIESNPLRGDWNVIPTEIVNETTVRFYNENAEAQAAFYMCSDIEGVCRRAMQLIVDHPPDVRDFHCISNNLDDLNCTWTSRNALAKYKLIERTNDYEITECRFMELDFKPNMSCAWRTQNDVTMKSTAHLILLACNHFGCLNKTYEFRYLAVLKLDPPRSLKTLQIGSHNVLLQWKLAHSRRIIHRIELDHRVEFWYAGTTYESANTSSLIEDYDTYELELQLPCSKQSYEVRVSMKSTEAKGEEYWSDYRTIYFETNEASTQSNDVDPRCGKKVMRETREVMFYKIGELRDYFNSETWKAITEINKLKAREMSIGLRLEEQGLN